MNRSHFFTDVLIGANLAMGVQDLCMGGLPFAVLNFCAAGFLLVVRTEERS